MPLSAQARYHKRWAADRARGVRHTTDAAPVVEHLRSLVDAGMTALSIARATGLGHSTIHGIMHGHRTSHVRTGTARRILAVRVGPVDTDADVLVLNVGARRRIRALLALGWTHEHLRAASGIRTAVLLHQAGTLCTSRTHQRIAELYDRLSMTPGPSALSRERARRAGYPPPLAWDEGTIDDPLAQPCLGEPDQRRRRLLPPVDDLRHLLDQGCSVAELADRYGVDEASIDRALRRAVA